MPRPQGFSLIELLVVLMIMALVLSLLGAPVQKIYTQQMAQQELRILRAQVKAIAVHAYTFDSDIEIIFEGSRLTAMEAKQIDDFELDLGNQQGISAVKPAGYSGRREQQQDDPFAIDDEHELSDSWKEEALSPLLNLEFEYIRFPAMNVIAMSTGRLTQDFIQVSIGSAGSIKDVNLRGLVFDEKWQAR